MSERRVIEAKAIKEGKWWNISIPELDQVTATKRSSEVQEYAESLAAGILDVPESTLEVTIKYPMPEALVPSWEKAQERSIYAKEIAADAAAQSKAVMQGLQREGYALRDIAKVLGLSFQRVSQILSTEKTEI